MEIKELQKRFALQEEFETANKFMRLGFGELQNINLDNDFYFLPFQLLSQGFERFLKAYICVAYYENHNIFPHYKYLKELGHDLMKLLTNIKENFYIKYDNEQFQIDWDFLEKDEDLKELLSILSEFGKLARYYNFDFITDNTKIGINPKEDWLKFENRIMPINEEMAGKLNNHDVAKEVYQEITNYIVIVFEKFIASLSRQIIFNTLGSLGKQLTTSSFFDYGCIYEGEYGKTDYRKETTKFRETPKSIHKRTIVDKLNRMCNPNFKSKKMEKQNYDGDWPFYAEKIVIECRYKHWCIVTIGNHDYALNGSAKGKYKLENPHEAGMAELGKSIGEFIKMAREL